MKRTRIYDIGHRLLTLMMIFMMSGNVVWAQTFYYGQDYESGAVDWSTSVNGRYTPVIMEDGGNHFLSVTQNQRFNNGCTLTCTATDQCVAAGKDFVMTFDLKVSSSNNQSPTEFIVYDAANTGFIFKLAANGTTTTSWKLNGTTDITLPNSDKSAVENSIANVDWLTVKIKRTSATTNITIAPKSGGDNIYSSNIEASATGGLGKMVFNTKRYNANFAIDNVSVSAPFSYNATETEVDITRVGTADRPAITGLPTIIDELSAATISYASSDQSVARIDNDGNVYLVGLGTTNISAAKTVEAKKYSTSYTLTVTGAPATVTKTATTADNKTTCTWTLCGEGTVDQSVELGAITMTCAWESETAIAVIDDSYHPVLKVIDANGYAHPNTGGSLPETNYGGTFYKFTTVETGKLTLTGHMSTAELKTSDKTTPCTTDTKDDYQIVINSLPAGTYYLYSNSSAYIPILYSFKFIYDTPALEWSNNTVTVDIMEVGNSNPNLLTTEMGLPTLTNKGGYDISSYSSSDEKVAKFWDNKLNICGPGTTTITVTDANSNTASYTLTVEGATVTHTYNGSNTISFNDEGVLAKSSDTTGNKSETLSTGLTVDYGYTGKTAIVANYGMGTVVKMIDANGFSHPNLGEGDAQKIPVQNAAGGTYFKLTTTKAGYLIVTGNVSTERTVLYKDNNSGGTYNYDNATPVVGEFDLDANTFSAELQSGCTYFLYNKRTTDDIANGIYVPLVHSITYVPGFFPNAYEITSVADASTYTIQTPKGFTSPEFTIVNTKGHVGSPEISGSNITGITGGGAIRIRAEESTSTADYVLTVAYPATVYPGKQWNFNPEGEAVMNTSDGLKAWPVPYNTTTDADGGGWKAFWKNANEGFERGQEWGHNAAVHGDNAFFVPETAGLVFNTTEQGFYLRNSEQDANGFPTYQNIGIRKYGASFTIPQLEEGDIVELNWKHETGTSGSNFTVTNLTDLRGKDINDVLAITGSADRGKDNNPGLYSFIAKGGDVTFTLKDHGNCDILAIRIYKGPYRSTMSAINLDGNGEAPATMLVDNALSQVKYNYCNQLNSTATGPAMYVLKGFIDGTDNDECVTGCNSQKAASFSLFTDKDAYPISEAEKNELYELRKNLVGFRMYNHNWNSLRNAYNTGIIEATDGWGKVTIRMNNYTNDMKYLIAYTNDYTLTIGQKPHQDYPYTWNFDNISGGEVKGKYNNVANSVSDDFLTWTNMGYETFALDTEITTENIYGSMYVPGAALVTKERDLGANGSISDLNADGKGCDELNGLGFNGKIIFKLAQQGNTANDAPATLPGSSSNSLLIYQMDYAGYDAENSVELTAGDGKVKFGSPKKREATVNAECGYAYKLDGGNTKNVLLRPERPFQNGDVIHLKGYSTASILESGFSFYAGANDDATAALTTVHWTNDVNTEQTVDYTVTRGDGLAGRSEVYLFRANKKRTVYLTVISITGDDSAAPTSYKRALTCPDTEGAIITIPDLTTGHYVYIKASSEPDISSTNLRAAKTDDGLDAATGVYKYVVTADGPAEVTFAQNTEVYRIGVTNILKPMKKVGASGAWATESRDHAIDYEQTGALTVNNIQAHTVAAKEYTPQKVTVKLNEVTGTAVPEETGLVLKLDLSDDAKVTNFKKAKENTTNSIYELPLFYPPYSKAIATTEQMKFGGTMGNMMKENVTEQLFTAETEVVGSINYTRFFLADRYMKWKKEDGTLSRDANFTDGTVPVFYRMHLYDDTEASSLSSTETVLNTLGANKAYLLLNSSSLPDALWTTSASVRPYIGIDGVSDMEEITEQTEQSTGIYNLKGQKVAESERQSLAPGIYIKNGKKIIIR